MIETENKRISIDKAIDDNLLTLWVNERGYLEAMERVYLTGNPKFDGQNGQFNPAMSLCCVNQENIVQ